MFRRYLQALNVNPKHRQSRRTSRRLCLEPLEPRQLLSVVPAVGSLPNWPPVISSPVAVLDATSGRTAALSVSASDDRPESQLTYTWKVASKPNGAPTPTFAANRSNAAKATEVTFGRPGSYLLSATAIDAGKLGATSLVAIDVPQVLTNISVSPASVSLYTGDPQTFHAHGYDQFGRRLATPPAWTWTASAGQIDTIGRFRAPDTAATVTIDVSSGSMHGTAQAEVRVNTPPTVATPASAVLDSADGKTATLTVLGDDDAGEAKLKYTWTATVTPTGAPKPTFSVNRTNAAKNSTVTFGRAGTYQLTATIADAKGLTVTSPVTIVVTAALTQIAVEPASATIYAATTQTFAAHALDQFGQALSPAPVLTWTTGAGQIDAAGRFTAPGSTGTVTISAASGAVRSQTQVQVTPAFQDIRDGQLQPLLRSLFVDRAIDRADMVRVLRSVGDDDGQVDATELSDLQTLLDRAPSLAMPNHVRVLAGNVVRGNPANALYQGQTLGNLLVGSTDGQLDKLVDKWFLGADHPVAAGVYRSIAGPLFVAGPSYTDMDQGSLGDCYLIAALGAIAKSSAAAIQSMFQDNGDDTWTVRFFSKGIADYVTVDRWLPTNSTGRLIYANRDTLPTSQGYELWLPLAEKAYVQWNETGRSGQDGTNRYDGIAAGSTRTVLAQVLGRTPGSYTYDDVNKQALIDAIGRNQAVTTGTFKNIPSGSGLIAYHAYAVIGYDAATDTFRLANPHGTRHPGPLSWAQLKQNCGYFGVADARAAQPFGSVGEPAVLADAPVDALMAELAETTGMGDGHACRGGWPHKTTS